ncbi:hypothetical protein CAI21_07155 [Alkalilimnicola ehrlichii]|uniref:Phospholipid/glycerol acyltransferase domain-containing protein n=1 Tax=Alkalilimnicola ehrlichii TaxID=351052 RepID=A0A3E0WY85_9GAMM|nr:1-acyl-sn-glycerol-3-phosphate acyltransferase [Alkalilimnicola ehrlichii]RFA30370.1 hypothetical protein CAI21_07155 [Alkalilimnicola ehrlichii]RFA37942.1 hypothetical protein CAL65_08495 [Alkalilimnicola ehrlichii]
MLLLRKVVRLPLAFLWLLVGVLWIRGALLWDRLRGRPRYQGAARCAQAWWCRGLCRLLGIRVQIEGESLAAGPVLVVANHISWLDIPVFAAYWPLAFLSKSEVRRWPLVGGVASGLGTLYIERGERDGAARAAERMRERLAAGERVLFFPEGTTSEGFGLLPFRPRLLQAALDAGAVVQPVTIRYTDADGTISRLAPFINDTPLIRHTLRLAGQARMNVRIHVGQPIVTLGKGRTDVAREARAAMAASLGLDEFDDVPVKTVSQAS